MYSFKGWQNNKNYAFPSKHCISNEKICYCYTFYNENHTTYLYITCNKKILFLKNISACCGYLPTSPFFLLLSEHKHCDNAATNSNSETAKSRTVASLQGSGGTGTREVKYWACLGCWISQCYGPFLLGAHFENYESFISLIFQIFFGRR